MLSWTSNLYPDSGYIYVDVHMLPDTSCSFGIRVDYITATLLFIYAIGRLNCIPLYPATDGRQTVNWQQFCCGADTRNMLTATSGYNLLPGNMCPGVNAALYDRQLHHGCAENAGPENAGHPGHEFAGHTAL